MGERPAEKPPSCKRKCSASKQQFFKDSKYSCYSFLGQPFLLLVDSALWQEAYIFLPSVSVGPSLGWAMAPGGHAVINTIHHHQGLCD